MAGAAAPGPDQHGGHVGRGGLGPGPLAAAAGEWITTVLHTALLAQLGQVQDRIRYRTAGTNTWRHTFAGLVAEGQSLRDAQTLAAAWVFLALVAQRWGELRQVILQLHSAGW